MKFQIYEQAARILRKRKKHNIYVLAVSIAAVFTCAGVVFGLTRPGRAFSSLEKTLNCNVEVHTHTADCYDAEGNLICGYADYVAHVHDPETCYDENGDLVCTLPEIIPHVHDDSCYIERMELICGIEEGQVVDENGNPVFDENGNPLFDINAVPDTGSIEVLGTVEEGTESAENAEGTESAENAEGTESTENAEGTESTENAEGTTENTEGTTESVEGTENAETETQENVTEQPTDETLGTNQEGEASTETETENVVDNGTREEASNGEAPAENTEPEVVTETVDVGGAGADISIGPKYTTHVHTAECYRIVKELVCTIPALHVHTADCYDENGNLICGQLQLSQHVHGEECFCYEEKTVTKTAVAGDYTITATYGASAKIPSKAELRAYIVQPDNEAYNNDLELTKQTAGDDAEVEAIINIGFYLGDKEYEPEGPVDVKITLNKENFSTGDDVTILHIKDDNTVETLESTVDESNATTISTDSFSDFIILKGEKKFEVNRKYGKYWLGLIDGSNSFSSDTFSRLRTYKGESYSNFLGEAAYFHIVAFNNYYGTGTDVCGNLCVKNLMKMSESGTKNWPYEATYIQNIDANAVLSPRPGRNTEGSVVVFGPDVELDTYDNGNQIKVNGVAIESPSSIYIEDGVHRFVDLESMRLKIQKISNDLALTKDGGATITYGGNDWKNVIKLEEANGAGYITLDAIEFMEKIAGNPLKLDGFSDSGNGTLVINIDCKNVPDKGTITLPQESVMCVDGSMADTGEAFDHKHGKVIWNFINADGKTIVAPGRMHGVIIAPDSTFIAKGNLQGQIIAYNVYTEGETHRSFFIGTTLPVATELAFQKTVAGLTPDPNQKFTFSLSEYKGKKWVEIQTAQNSGKDIVFEDLVYENESDLGTHWYKVTEVDKSGDTDTNKYIYDTKLFVLKTEVTFNVSSSKYEATSETFEIKSDADITYDANKNIVGVSSSAVSITDDSQKAFDNTPKYTKISVTKKWEDYQGVELIDDLPDSLTVYLYRSKNSGEGDVADVTGLTPIETVALNKDNNWTYTWDELLTKDEADGKKFVYFVTEAGTPGYEAASRSHDSWFIQGTQEFVNKKNFENTYIEIEKKFYGFNEKGEKVEIDNPDPTNAMDGYIKVRLEQIATDASGNSADPVRYTDPVKVGGNEKTFANGEFKITAADGWKIRIDELPKAKVDANGNVITYTYQVTELECSLKYAVDGDAVTLGTVAKDESDNEYRLFTLKNILKPTELEIDKNWFTYTGSVDSLQTSTSTDVTIKLNIVRTSASGTDTPIGSMILGIDGCRNLTRENGEAFEATQVVDPSTSYKYWAVKLKNLPAYYVATGADGKTYLEKYKYSVTEDTIAGYELVDADMTDENGTVILGKSTTTSELTNEGVFTTIILKNRSTSTFALPETGGRGRNFTALYVVGALMLIGSAALLIYRKKL
ncbi:MAG: Cna B-type domain-containing protein [Lachnospiraceae bacterium]|nr:Cna B-type domain-containing protein [Lachnospiraceae bacterium]